MPTTEPKRRIVIGRLSAFCSLVLLCYLASCYLGRFDYCTAITVFPVWVWLLPGFLLTALQYQFVSRRSSVVTILLWFVLLLIFADTPMSLLRGVVRASPTPSVLAPDALKPSSSSLSIRVITLNCASSAKAVLETSAYRPDIVLLQESPSEEALLAFAKQLYGEDGSVLWSSDVSLVTRGRITPIEVPPPLRGVTVGARVCFDSSAKVTVISLRLLPSTFRFDLWSPRCWIACTENRRKRRDQLRAVMEIIPPSASVAPLIIGGDFNAPPGDAIFQLLRTRLADTFQGAGIGWGNTIVNNYPFHRIDQIWTNHRFEAKMVCAKKNKPFRSSDRDIRSHNQTIYV